MHTRDNLVDGLVVIESDFIILFRNTRKTYDFSLQQVLPEVVRIDINNLQLSSSCTISER